MSTIKEYIHARLKEIALKLPVLINHDPADFYSGHTSGYKQALIDMQNFIEEQCKIKAEEDSKTIYAVYEELE